MGPESIHEEEIPQCVSCGLKCQGPRLQADADMHACTEHLSPGQICERLGEVTGAEFKLVPMTKEQFHSEEHKRKLGEARWSHLRGYADGWVRSSFVGHG